MDFLTIAWAGFVAIVFAAAIFWLFRSLGLTRFSPGEQLGCLFFDDPRHPGAETVGFLLLVLLGTTLIPAAYAGVFALATGPSWGAGLALGAVHGLMAAAALPFFGTISACVRAGAIPAPGPFGTKWGWLTPAALLFGHGVYGAVLGAILASM